MTPDIIAARQDRASCRSIDIGPELDLRPQLERLDRLICWSENIDEGALTFAFRPLWQLNEPAKAALALSRAQATQVYAGLKLWPDAVMAKLAEAQLVADGTYPNAAAVFAARDEEMVTDAREVGPVSRAGGGSWPGEEEPRDWHGRWMTGAEGGAGALIGSAASVASPVQGQQLAGPMPVPNTPADPSGVAGQGPDAPDGTPVELASSKGPARALARLLGALAAAVRSTKRWWPEEPDEPEPSLPSFDPGVHESGTNPQTEKNKLAQQQDPRIRSDLADRWIRDDGWLNWPEMNGGSDAPETPLTLQPGQIVDRYGEPTGAYLSPQGVPFRARSLPH